MTSLPARAAASAWVATEPGLADAVGDWSNDLAGDDPARHAAAVARPGLLPPLRSLRYLAALHIANAQWASGQLSSPDLRPVRQPDAWAKEGIAEMAGQTAARHADQQRVGVSTSDSFGPSTGPPTRTGAIRGTTRRGRGRRRTRMTTKPGPSKMPTVWRPCAQQLGLWRMFYNGWPDLDCVARPGDRAMDHHVSDPTMTEVWDQVATGTATLLEVHGLPEPDAPDIDEPLLGAVEQWLDDLFASDPEFHMVCYDEDGNPTHLEETFTLVDHGDDPLVAVLATRNGAVEQAEEIVERLAAKHGLDENVIVASTVDSYQGQTNALTIAVHPLSGATELNEFNSAFGRLAVVCTRATHGLLLVSRPGLDALLNDAPARPGTPLGEPGTRELPRQTHRRILSCFARGPVDTSPSCPHPIE